MVVENSGLLTVAALKHLDVKGKKIVSILSGGNMDVITMSSVVQHGTDPERPDLYRIRSASRQSRANWFEWPPSFADEQGNVIKLDHNQFVSTNRNAAVELKITMEAFGTEHKKKIVNALKQNGYNPKLIGAIL